MHYSSKKRNEEQKFTALLDSNDVMNLGSDDFASLAIDEAGAHNIENIRWKIEYVNPIDDIVAISIEGLPADTITHPEDLKDKDLTDIPLEEFSVEVCIALQTLVELEGSSVTEKLSKKLIEDGIPNVDEKHLQYRIAGCNSKYIVLRVWGWFSGINLEENIEENAYA